MENGTEGEWGDKDKIKFVTLLDSVQGQNRSRASLWKVEDAGAWTTSLKGNQAEEVTHSRLKSWKGGGVPGVQQRHGTCFWHAHTRAGAYPFPPLISCAVNLGSEIKGPAPITVYNCPRSGRYLAGISV